MDLNGRRVLLTGATGGLGHAIARALHGRGASLVLTGRRADVLEPLAAETGGSAVAADLSDPAAVEPLLAEAGEIDVLVANAAVPGSGPVLDYSIEELDRALTVNLRAPMVLARLLGEQMVARRSGHLLFVSSLSGKAAAAGSAVYCATKFGLRGFAMGLRGDLHGTGVGVTVVYPGFISDAGMFAEAEVPLPRYAGTKKPEDVGAAVVRGIERNTAEIDVAPLGMRLGAHITNLAPGPSLAIQRRLGAERIAAGMAEGQRSKR
jgi:short-subunit dehydrogenase